MDAMEEDFDELGATEKMREEELRVWEESHGENVKWSKPRALIPLMC